MIHGEFIIHGQTRCTSNCNNWKTSRGRSQTLPCNWQSSFFCVWSKKTRVKGYQIELVLLISFESVLSLAKKYLCGCWWNASSVMCVLQKNRKWSTHLCQERSWNWSIHAKPLCTSCWIFAGLYSKMKWNLSKSLNYFIRLTRAMDAIYTFSSQATPHTFGLCFIRNNLR